MKEGKDLIRNMIRKYLKLYRTDDFLPLLYDLDYKVNYYGLRF